MEQDSKLFLIHAYLRQHPELAKPTLICIGKGKYALFIIPLIVHLRADSNYTYIYLYDTSKPIVITGCLARFGVQLPEDLFMRVNRSEIINVFMVSSYTTKPNAITLIDGQPIVIAESHVKDFRKRFRFLFGPLDSHTAEEHKERGEETSLQF